MMSKSQPAKLTVRPANWTRRALLLLAILSAVAAAGAKVINRPKPAPVIPVAPTPTPWQYDQANDRHWDPTHNHWHSGPPPASVQQ